MKIQACAKGTELCKTKLVQMGVEGWGWGVGGMGACAKPVLCKRSGGVQNTACAKGVKVYKMQLVLKEWRCTKYSLC